MRRNLQRMMVALAAMMICLGASAIDKVVRKTGMSGEVTSVEALASSTFMLQNGSGDEAVVLYTPSGWDIKVAPLATAIASQDNGGFYKLEALDTHYLIPVYNIDMKTHRETPNWGDTNAYVNAQPSGDVIFGLAGRNSQHGQDGPNLAVWDITYVEGQGFAFHCVGRDVYIGHDGTAARPSTTAVYWKAYKSYGAYVQSEVENAYTTALAAAKATDAKDVLATAKAAYDTDADVEAFGDAVNAAIDLINACEKVNAAYANLDEYGAAIATEVLAKYNKGDYKNAAELVEAYRPAVKAQKTAGSDFTGLIINSTIDGTSGWTVEKSVNGNGPLLNNVSFEYWSYTEGKGGFDYWQEITGLPNGTYTITADMYNDQVAPSGNTFAAAAGVYGTSGTDTQMALVDVQGATFNTYTTPAVKVSNGTLRIGIKNAYNTMPARWFVADNFKLTLVALAPTYAVTVAEGIENGTVEADPTEAYEGDKVTLTITPAEGYELDALSVKNGENDVEVAEDYTFTMPAAAVTVSATFKEAAPAPTTYAVTIAEGIENGTVEADVAEAAEGTKVTLTIKADDGYELDEISVKNGEDDVEVAADSTFIMPAGAVLVSATFKEKAVEPEPTLAAVKMTYVELNQTEAFGEVTEAKAGFNKIANDEVGFGNTDWGCNWITYIDVDASALKGSVAKATLKAEISGSTDSKRNTGWGVGYNSSAWSADMTYETADKSITTLGDLQWSTQKSAATFESVEFNITDAFKNGAKKATILVYETAAAGGFIKNVTVEMDMIPAAPEITNASFETDGEKAASNGALAITGWTMNTDGSFNNTELRPANSTSTTSQFGTSDPSDGEYSLFFRHGWNGGGVATTITSDALDEIPAGDYTLSVDYKQYAAYDNDNQKNSNTKVSIALINGENTLGSETSPAAESMKGAGVTTYFNTAEWSTLTASFSLAEAIPAGAKVVITLNAAGVRRSDFFIDNVQFTKIPGVELALLDLAKSIEAATAEKDKYSVGEGLFQYAAAEIEPLTTAIATAQAAYDAAESKDAVNAAKTTLDEFVAGFAPAMTTPDVEKQYTFQLKVEGETPLYMNLTTAGITIAETATPLSFVATENAGQFNLVADGELYVGLAGGNAWTMSTAADKKAAWTFTALGNGEYNINNLVTPGRFVGTNAADKTAGTSCYADKQTSNGNVVWMIAEYVVPEIALNAPTFNVEEGTQAEPNMLPAGSTLKITYTADNLAANGVDAMDVKVKVTVLVSGDLPENVMNMQSETKHSVMGETFYIPLGETDFPVALKEGYVYQNIVVMAAALVKQGETAETDEVLATYAGEPAQLHWVGIAAPTYAITIADGIENGTVEADAEEAEEGATVKLTITPAENYELDDIVIIYEVGEGEGAEKKYIEMAEDSTFIMPAAAVTVFATFKNPNDYTNMIVNADLTGEGGFDATGTKGIDGSGIVKVGNAALFDFKQTITLPAGQYKLTAQAAYRYGDSEQAEADAIAAGTETKLVQLYATVAEDTLATPVQNRYDGASETDYANGDGSVTVNELYVPNSSNAVKAWFAAGQYVNEVVFNVFEEGEVTIGINRTGLPDFDYTVIGPWTLTRLGDAEIPEIALNAPTFNVEEGTQAEPNMLPAGSTLKITYTADNLAENGVDADDVMVRMTVLVTGDLPENLMNMQSETKHSVMGTFYIPLGETDFPVALKEGYVYQNIVVMAAQLVKQGETAETDEELAVYAGEPVQLHWVGLEAPATATYAITIADELEGGEVEADVEEAAEGETVSLTITPDENYELKALTVSYVDGEETKYVEVGEGYTFNMPAAPVTVSATFIYVDPNLIEIAQETNQEAGGVVTLATKEEFDDYTLYTFKDQVCVAIKILNVDVTGCDYVVVKFAEPVPAGIKASFVDGEGNEEIPEGATEIKNVIATNTSVKNGIMPQITILTIWDGNGKSVKVTGVYKHLAEEPDAIDAIETAEDVKADGKYMENGKLVIIKNGHKYNASGLRIK